MLPLGIIGLQSAWLSNGFTAQYGVSKSWVTVYYPTAYTKRPSVQAVDFGAAGAYGFKCVYDVSSTSFVINTKTASGANFNPDCCWLSMGY